MKKSIFIVALAVLTTGSVHANTLTDIQERLDSEVQAAREEFTKEGRRTQRFNKESDRLAIQRNVVRPTYGDVTTRKDSESIRRNIESENKLDYAIKQRQARHFYRKYIRTNDYKNRLNQIEKHNVSRAEGRTSDRSTQMQREGELQSVPYYQERRQFNTPSSIRSNSKQVFRRRAVDYYLNGGNADTNVLRTGVLRSSTHSAPRTAAIPVGKQAPAKADVLKSLRSHQKRTFRTLDKVPTGYQKQTQLRGGSYGRSYTNPYQFQYIQE